VPHEFFEGFFANNHTGYLIRYKPEYITARQFVKIKKFAKSIAMIKRKYKPLQPPMYNTNRVDNQKK
jgi:hypothetical protein